VELSCRKPLLAGVSLGLLIYSLLEFSADLAAL